MERKESPISAKETHLLLEIGDSTLRKWCLALEEQGYHFPRTENNKRVFYSNDLDVLRYFRNLVQVQGFSLENAAKVVASRFKEDERTVSAQKNSENEERSLSDSYTKFLEELQELREFNKQLLTKLDQQQKYIDERLNRLEERENERFKLLDAALREAQETRKLIASSQKEKKGFWSRLFGK